MTVSTEAVSFKFECELLGDVLCAFLKLGKAELLLGYFNLAQVHQLFYDLLLQSAEAKLGEGVLRRCQQIP